MTYIALIAVAGILLLQWSIGTGIGGSLVIGLATLVALVAVGIHEAWTKGRGVTGWIVSIIVALVGAYVVATIGGMVIDFVLSPFMGGARSLAAAGGPVMSVALACGVLAALLGAWGALWIVGRWR